MKIDILTLFPEMFAPLKESILGRSQKEGLFELNLVNIRDFSDNKHQKCDDYPYGGGAGMVMTPGPVFRAWKSVKSEGAYCIYLSPKGKVLNQQKVRQLSEKNHLILLCGHYEGIDQRVIELCVDEEISIGDYVLTGGEIPAMVLADAVLRYVPGVLNPQSLAEESHASGLLEYPQYTRPEVFENLKVPEVLLSGHHGKVDQWRHEQSVNITEAMRPDMLSKNKKE